MAKSFLRSLLFPLLSPGGAGLLAAGTAVITFCESLGGLQRKDPRSYLLPMVAALIASYLYRLLEETVSGNESAPSLKPDDWNDIWEDLARYLGGIGVAFLPVWILLLYALFEQKGHIHRGDFQTALAVCFVLGTLYLPMALLLNGFTQKFATGFNLGAGMRAIRIMGGDYVLCALLFLAGDLAWVALEFAWVHATPPGFNAARAAAAAVTSFAGIYVSVLQMRFLGKAYRKHYEALGWSLGAEG